MFYIYLMQNVDLRLLVQSTLRLSCVLQHLHEWLKSNHLNINVRKTEPCIFISQQILLSFFLYCCLIH